MLELIDKPDDYIESDSKTVGGWVTELLGDIPEEGASLVYKELEITAVSVEDQRIIRLIMKYSPDTED